MNAVRYFSVQAPVNLFFTVVILIASLILIPPHGIAGASLATVLVFVCQIPVKGFLIGHALIEGKRKTV
jgi:O-antigen/teichoic acid export membrane protein